MKLSPGRLSVNSLGEQYCGQDCVLHLGIVKLLTMEKKKKRKKFADAFL